MYAPGYPRATNSGALMTLFEPVTLGRLVLDNRIVMAPMTRSKSPGAVPGPRSAGSLQCKPAPQRMS